MLCAGASQTLPRKDNPARPRDLAPFRTQKKKNPLGLKGLSLLSGGEGGSQHEQSSSVKQYQTSISRKKSAQNFVANSA